MGAEPGEALRHWRRVRQLASRPDSKIGAEMLARLHGVAASTGSACHSGRIEMSPVLRSMGVGPEVGIGAVRFSLGRSTTREEIDTVVERLSELLAVAA